MTADPTASPLTEPDPYGGDPMFRHLTTSLTLLALGWAADPTSSPGQTSVPRRTARHRRQIIDGSGSGFSLARTGRDHLDRDRPDRGDVPGWVLITLATVPTAIINLEMPVQDHIGGADQKIRVS